MVPYTTLPSEGTAGLENVEASSLEVKFPKGRICDFLHVSPSLCGCAALYNLSAFSQAQALRPDAEHTGPDHLVAESLRIVMTSCYSVDMHILKHRTLEAISGLQWSAAHCGCAYNSPRLNAVAFL